MKRIVIFIVCIIALVTVGFSKISTINSINEIKDLIEIGPNTLVVFDIDEVLISTEDLILRDTGSNHIPQKWNTLTQTEKDEILGIMFNKTEYLLVDPSMPKFIQGLERDGIKAIALTNNYSGKLGLIEHNEDRIEKRLCEKKINFKNFMNLSMVTFPELVDPIETPPLFKNGILYTNSFQQKETGGKGPLLGCFLDKVKWSPSNIIFFDDDMKNLISVEKELEARNIPYQGFHFKGAENLPNTFDERILALKFYYLSQKKSWLTNQEAVDILSKPLKEKTCD